MLFMLLSIAQAQKPFHEVRVTPKSSTIFQLDNQETEVLSAVVIRGNQEAIQRLPSHIQDSLQTLGGKSYRLKTSNAVEAIALAQKYSAWEDLQVWPDVTLHQGRQDFNDPNYGGQWYIETLEMESLWEHSLGDSNISIAVIDSGIDISHPDLADKIIAPIDVASGDNDPSPDPGEYCWDSTTAICDEHGTAVSGISTAMANNGEGIVGLCPECSLIPIKMLSENSGSLSADIAAFEHAIAQDAAVINNSWGFIQPTVAPEPLSAIIIEASTETRDGKGSLVVFAAGNDDRELIDGELCGIEGVLCISAIDSYGRPTAYTNYGADIDVAAPSATVSIAPNHDLTTNFGGTSAAAPVVSGIAGWIFSVQPELTSIEASELIISTAVQSPLISPDENGHHHHYGYGIINPTNIQETLFPYAEEDTGEEDSKRSCNHFGFSSLSYLVLPPLLLLLSTRRKL